MIFALWGWRFYFKEGHDVLLMFCWCFVNETSLDLVNKMLANNWANSHNVQWPLHSEVDVSMIHEKLPRAVFVVWWQKLPLDISTELPSQARVQGNPSEQRTDQAGPGLDIKEIWIMNGARYHKGHIFSPQDPLGIQAKRMVAQQHIHVYRLHFIQSSENSRLYCHESVDF